MLEDEKEIANKFIQLGKTTIAFCPELFNDNNLTFMQLLIAEGETSKTKLSTIKTRANLELSK